MTGSPILASVTVSVAIARPWRDIYERFWRPETFPRWASGMSDASLRKVGDEWHAQGPDGPAVITFSDHNTFGVMDHWIRLGPSRTVYVAMRIIANGDGAEAMLTLFREPGTTDEKFAADAEWVRRDLARLKELAERE